MKLFQNRIQAGHELSLLLESYKCAKNTLIFALPRGGVPVAYAISKDLQLPLDIFLVRKLGLPTYPELAMGAIALDNIIYINQDVITSYAVQQHEIDQVVNYEQAELLRRNKKYRQNKAFPSLQGKTVILVDDGVATGATMQVAINALKIRNCSKICIAIPVAPKDTFLKLQNQVDDCICIEVSDNFMAIGQFYTDFAQLKDEEVLNYLK